jgi:uncharacterized protein YodC (DUF2158 family)
MKFIIGSKVKLKSGSPDLTVLCVSEPFVEVSWRDGEDKENRYIWRDVCLVPA